VRFQITVVVNSAVGDRYLTHRITTDPAPTVIRYVAPLNTSTEHLIITPEL